MQGYFSKILLLQMLYLGLLASSVFGKNNATSELNSKLNLSTTLPTYELGAVEVIILAFKARLLGTYKSLTLTT